MHAHTGYANRGIVIRASNYKLFRINLIKKNFIFTAKSNGGQMAITFIFNLIRRQWLSYLHYNEKN